VLYPLVKLLEPARIPLVNNPLPKE
jgi:hypothetical protein